MMQTGKNMTKVITNKLSQVAFLGAFLGVSAFATTQATNTNTVSPTLKLNVTVQSAVQLTLASGSLCTVGAGSGTDYSVTFGNVDALAINNGTCGNKFAPTTPGTTNSVYYTDYTVTPVFTSQSVSTNTITAYVSSNFAKASLSVLQANSAPSAIGDLSAMSTSSGAPTSVASNATNATAINRYVGVGVAPTNGASLTGADAATITYTLTVQ
jgi:hypothetical protein